MTSVCVGFVSCAIIAIGCVKTVPTTESNPNPCPDFSTAEVVTDLHSDCGGEVNAQVNVSEQGGGGGISAFCRRSGDLTYRCDPDAEAIGRLCPNGLRRVYPDNSFECFVSDTAAQSVTGDRNTVVTGNGNAVTVHE